MSWISEFLSEIVNIVWGTPLIILLLGGGFFLLILSLGMPFLGFFHAFKLLFGKFHHNKDEKAEGQISHFQALSNALAATIGLGNIAGVAIAITQGGPGAVFWMWLTALIGMNTKFFECTLSIMYRGKDYRGETQGGPMYLIKNALPSSLSWLAVVFAICGLLGTQAIFQTNQLSEFAGKQYGFSPVAIGLACAAFTFIVLKGGLGRIAQVCSSLVPSMCVLYTLCALLIIVLNAEKILPVFQSIFLHAFTGEAAWGGAVGTTVAQIMRIGVKRAAFSNEAGMGTAPMAHGNAKTSEPVAEGLVGSIGPFLDTIIVCTMTALIILMSQDAMTNSESGILLTLSAFKMQLGDIGGHILAVIILLFSVSTMVGMANYNKKCWDFLFKGRWGLRNTAFALFFSTALFISAITPLNDVINLLDTGFALMAVPNMIATIYMGSKVVPEMKRYFKKYIWN